MWTNWILEQRLNSWHCFNNIHARLGNRRLIKWSVASINDSTARTDSITLLGRLTRPPRSIHEFNMIDWSYSCDFWRGGNNTRRIAYSLCRLIWKPWAFSVKLLAVNNKLRRTVICDHFTKRQKWPLGHNKNALPVWERCAFCQNLNLLIMNFKNVCNGHQKSLTHNMNQRLSDFHMKERLISEA